MLVTSSLVSDVIVVLLTLAIVSGGGNATSNPRIVEHPDSQYVAKNEPATLNCKAEGDPTPVITWYRDGQLITTANENPSSHRMLLPSGQLFFLRIINNKNTKPDVGTYYCNATNPITGASAVSRSATLEIAALGSEFRTEPRSSDVAIGSDVILECRPPRGLPEPRVRWTKDGSPLRTSDRLTVADTGSLRIHEASKSDSGDYVCVAYNIGGEKESVPATLNVREKPRIVDGPKDILVQENSDVLFHCRASGEPEPTIIWKKINDQMPQGRLKILDDRSLKIERARASDDGVYVCRAENSVGWHEAEAKLTVHSQPSFLVTPRDKMVLVGRRAIFRCEVTGNPKPAVFWNKEASQTLMFPNQDHGRMSVEEDGTLTIEPVHMDDAGEYICKGLSLAGSAYAKARLDVKDVDPRPAPIIHQGPQNQTLPINSIALLQCLATGDPQPFIRWYHNHRVLPLRDTRFTLLHSGTLQISDLRKSDTGWYTCEASSETGDTTWSAALIVETPTNPSIVFHRTPEPTTFPGPPTKPVVSDVTETTARLTWRANPSHGASPVHAYTIEYFSHETGEGWVVASDSTSEENFIVRGLRPDTTYLFLVRARNSHGVSLPSHVTAPIRTQGLEMGGGHGVMPSVDLVHIRNKLSGSGPVVQLLSAVAVTSTSVKMLWQVRRNRRYVAGVHVRWRPAGSTDEFTDAIVKGRDQEDFTIEGLTPYSKYEVNVRPWYMSIVGLESNTMIVRTLEDVPSAPPGNVRGTLIDNTTLYLTWDPPPKYHSNGVLREYKIYLLGNESKFSREIPVNSSLEAVYIHHVVRNMTYRIQLSAATHVGEGVRSDPIVVGPRLASPRQDILQEPWFLGTVFGCLGGALWLGFCVISIWLYRRRCAGNQRKLKLGKNIAAYSAISQHQCDMTRVDGAVYNMSYGEKSCSMQDGPQFDGLQSHGKPMDTKEALYGIGNLQTSPALKTFYNKALLTAAPYATTDVVQAGAVNGPSMLSVSGGGASAFRPVQQSAYIIRAQTGGSSSDSCAKPDASSTSSNNDTTTNNEHSTEHTGMVYDSGHGFEQCDFASSPMSEYGPLDPAVYELSAKQPVLFLPPPPEHPPPSDIGTPPDSPNDNSVGVQHNRGRRLPHSDCERASPAQRRAAGPPPVSRYGTTGPAHSRSNHGPRREMTSYEQQRRHWNDNYNSRHAEMQQRSPCSPDVEVVGMDYSELESDVDLPASSHQGCYSPVSSVSDMDHAVNHDAEDGQLMADDVLDLDELSDSDVISSDEDAAGAGGCGDRLDDAGDVSADFACAVARAAERAGLTVVGSTVTDPGNPGVRKPPKTRRRPVRCTSPYSTDSNYETTDIAPRRPYPKSQRRRQLRQQQTSAQPSTQNLGQTSTQSGQRPQPPPISAKPKPPPIAAKPQVADIAAQYSRSGSSPSHVACSPALRTGVATVASTRRGSDSDSAMSRTNPLSAFDTRDTPLV